AEIRLLADGQHQQPQEQQKQQEQEGEGHVGRITMLPLSDGGGKASAVDGSSVASPASSLPRSANNNGPSTHHTVSNKRGPVVGGETNMKCGQQQAVNRENDNDNRNGVGNGGNGNDCNGGNGSSTTDVLHHGSTVAAGAMMLQQCLNRRYEGLVAGWEDVGTVRPTVKV
ncbi:hypothetical protein Vretimale_4025, partial [Volvox reticuliferus]